MALPFQSIGSLHCPPPFALQPSDCGWSWSSLRRPMVVWEGRLPYVSLKSLRFGSGQIYVGWVLGALMVARGRARSHLGLAVHQARRCQSLAPGTRHVCQLYGFLRVAAQISQNEGERRRAWEPWLLCLNWWRQPIRLSTGRWGHSSR